MMLRAASRSLRTARAPAFRPRSTVLILAALSSSVFASSALCDADGACSGERTTSRTYGTAAAAAMANKDRPSPIQFKDAEVEDIRTGEKKKFGDLWSDKPLVVTFLRRLGWQLCRVTAQDLDQLRAQVEPLGGRVVCLSFEHFGEGSDKDKSFEAGGYFKGPMYVISKEVYATLFGRKGLLNSFYGLGDMSGPKYQASKARGVTGNFAGDGMQLGGQFVIDTDGTILLDHRQGFYGDDEDNEGLMEAIKAAKGLKA